MHERVLAVPLIRTAHHPSAERRAPQRRAHRGEFTAVRPGVLVRPEHLDGLRPEERHLVLVRATAPSIRPPVTISHRSAAAVHGLPFVGSLPDRVDVTDPRRARGEITALLRVHAPAGHSPSGWADLPPAMPVEFADARATSLVRTLVDVASTGALVNAVPMIDAALHDRLVLPTMLAEELSVRGTRGRDKAQLAIGMGSAASGSPAESVCRVRFRQLGVPDAVQQHLFVRPGERTAIVDFWFPDQGVVVEVDGRAKYQDESMLDGRTTADVHWQEKQREDFIRSFAEVRTVVRVTWADLMDPERLRTKLRRAGVPCR